MTDVFSPSISLPRNARFHIAESLRLGSSVHHKLPNRKATLRFPLYGFSQPITQVLLGLAILLPLAGPRNASAQSLPKGGQYVAGSGSIASSGSAMTITQSSTHGIIDWQNFSIGSTNRVWFNNGNGATLNQVLGGNLTQIMGVLDATGSVYLINPNGLVVGPSGKIITGGSFIGSTLGLSNQQFMQGGTLDFSSGFGGPSGAVINNGKIVSQNGNVALLGYSASNLGNILAPEGTVALAAGNQVFLQPLNGPAGIYVVAGPSGNATNSGRIKAAAAALESAGGNVYELAGNQSGLINATGSQSVNGQVWLTAPAGTVSVSGTVKAQNANGSGGAIIAKGQSVALSASSSLNAAGLTGSGQIETSGQSVSLDGGKVNAGPGGTWAIDPTDLTIDATAASTIDSALNGGTNVTEETTATTPLSGYGTASSGPGDINVDAGISWSTSASLILSAFNSINVNAPVTVTGSGSLTLTNNNNQGGSSSGGSLNFAMGQGNVQFTGTGGSLTINSQPYTLIDSESELEGMSSSGYIALNSDITLDSSYTVYSSFAGTLEGLGHTISGLSINNSSGSNLGLFNTITGTVENLNVSGNITASGNAGILASNNQGTIYNVQTSGSITASNEFGGMVAENQGTIANSSSSATLTITPNDYMGGSIGGLVGYNTGSVTNSSGTGSIGISNSAENLTNVGGLIGDSSGPVTNSYSTENITLGQYVYSTGGLIGYDNGNVTGSYSTGSITLGNYNWYTGGLIGEEFEATISDSYSTGSINAGTNSYYTGGFLGQADYSSTIQTCYSTGAVTASGSYISGFLGGTTGGDGFGYPTFTSDYWNEDRSGTTTGVGSGSSSGVTGLSASGSSPFSASSYAGFNFTTTPGATGNNWVIVDTDGTLNGSNGGTMPMLASEYSTTINNTHQLQLMAMDLSASYTLGNNIDASATGSSTSSSTGTDVWGPSGFIPVGGNDAAVFTGSLSGQGNSISNLVINTSETQAGLFGNLGSGAVVENLGLVAGSTTGSTSGTDVGSLAGSNDGTITNTYASGPVSSPSDSSAGGLVGYNFSDGTITDAYATGAVSGNYSNLGGLVGTNAGTVTDDYATGAVNGGAITGGGLVGYNEGTIANAYATGALTSSAGPVGGLIGGNAASGSVTDAYATGAVTGSGVGGLSGNNSGSFTDVYWDTTTSGTTTGVGSGSSTGVTGDTTSQLQAAMPVGFSSSTWGNVNNQTTPYLLSTPGPVYVGNLLSTLIFNMPELQAVNNNLTSNYALANDIDASSYTGFTPIGESTAFTGTFNGLGNTVSNLVISTAGSYAGLFGEVGSGGTVENVGLVGGSTTDSTTHGILGSLVGSNYGTITNAYASGAVSSASDSTAGGLVGYNASGATITDAYATGAVSDSLALSLGGLVGFNVGTITDAWATGTVSGTSNELGGLVGFNDGTITDAYATGEVSGSGIESDLGGLAGVNYGTITDAYATGKVSGSGSESDLGGLVGINGGTITDAYATGAVSGTGNLGGLVGYNDDGDATITDAYATGAVSGTGDVGGLVGLNENTITASYWDTTTSGATAGVGSGSSSGATGLTTIEWLTQGPVATGTWDTETTWVAGYPYPVLKALPYVLITGSGTQTYGSSTPNLSILSITDQNGNDATSLVNTSGIGAITTATSTSNVGSGPYVLGGIGATVSPGYQLTYTGSLTVNPATLTAGLTGTASKTYDGTTTATLAPANYTLSGVIGSDQVTLNDPISGSYASQNVGTGIGVSVSGLTLSGTSAGNYTLASTTASSNIGTIVPATLTAGLTGNASKTYDGTTTATLAPANYTLSGVIGSDQVTLNDPTSGAYASQNVGTGIGVSVSGLTLSGSAAGNYVLGTTTATGNIGTITPATLTAGLTGLASKIYNSTATATLAPVNYTLSGVIGSDQVTLNDPTSGLYASKNAGTGIGVSVSGLTLSGSAAGNYTLASTTASGDIGKIVPATLTAGLTGIVSGTYNGTTVATLAPDNYTLSGVIGSDQVTLNDPTSGVYAGKNAGTGIGVSVSGLTLSGSAAGNYVLAGTAVSGNVGQIVPATLTAGLTGVVSAIANGTTAATLTPANYTLTGVIPGDQVTLNDPTSGVYGTASAGTGIPVTVSGLSLFGANAGNYTLANTTITGNVGVILPAGSTEQPLLPFITTLPTPVAASGAGSLVLIGAGNGFGPIPSILLPSNTAGTIVTPYGVAVSTGLSLTVDPEQTLNQTGGTRHLQVNLPPPAGAGDEGGQQ